MAELGMEHSSLELAVTGVDSVCEYSLKCLRRYPNTDLGKVR